MVTNLKFCENIVLWYLWQAAEQELLQKAKATN